MVHTGATVTLLLLLLCCMCLLSTASGQLVADATRVRVSATTRDVDGEQYKSYTFQGQGSQWKDTGAGVEGLVIPPGGAYNVLYANGMEDEETLIHAHGLTPPANLDGVPYLSAVPLFANRSAHYAYGLDGGRNNGTYFMHSHYGFQLGNGLVAPVIVEGNDPTYPLYSSLEMAQDAVVLLEDLCPSPSEEFIAMKRSMAFEPRTDINDAATAGTGDCSSWYTFLALAVAFNESQSEPSVTCPDVEAATDADVIFTSFLANGKTFKDPVFVTGVQEDGMIRLRVINACGMTAMRVQLPFSATLVAVDGQWVQPYVNSQFWIAVSQRLDILVDVSEVEGQMPETNGTVWFAAVAYSESTTESIPSPLVFVVGGDVDQAQRDAIAADIARQKVVTGMMAADMESQLRAFTPLPYPGAPDVTFTARLTGDNGFRGINDVSYRLPPTAPLPFVPNPNPFLVQYGQWVQIDIENNNPDSHPMHLHGHHFQVVAIDGQQLEGAVRDVILVPGGCHNVSVVFQANNPGVWPFHCHLEFHQAAGMLTTFEYVA